MVTFRNNTGRRNNFRRSDRNFKSNGDRQKFSSNLQITMKILKGNFLANNQNAPKLIEKYNDLAREASSNGDKILSKIICSMQPFTRVLMKEKTIRERKFLKKR